MDKSIEEQIIKEYKEKFGDLLQTKRVSDVGVHATGGKWVTDDVEQFIRDALAKYKAEILEDAIVEISQWKQEDSNYISPIYETNSYNAGMSKAIDILSELKGKNE